MPIFGQTRLNKYSDMTSEGKLIKLYKSHWQNVSEMTSTRWTLMTKVTSLYVNWTEIWERFFFWKTCGTFFVHLSPKMSLFVFLYRPKFRFFFFLSPVPNFALFLSRGGSRGIVTAVQGHYALGLLGEGGHFVKLGPPLGPRGLVQGTDCPRGRGRSEERTKGGPGEGGPRSTHKSGTHPRILHTKTFLDIPNKTKS